MNFDKVKLIFFSPTNTTKTVLESIARGMSIKNIEHFNLTPPQAEIPDFDGGPAEMAIIGTPVYGGGRVPLLAIDRLKGFKASGTPAVIVVLYGNREFDDALLELTNLATEAGFRPVAGAAFIGEHSFSNAETPIAAGRPDADDQKKAREFGETVIKKLSGVEEIKDLDPIQVPGNVPHHGRGAPNDASPITDPEICILCGTCASVCPTGAIVVGDEVITNGEACILCCACVKNCPTEARLMEVSGILQVAKFLNTNFSKRKEPEIFL